MKKRNFLVALIVSLGLTIGPLAGDAVAAPKKKAATVKHHKAKAPKSAKGAKSRHSPRRAAHAAPKASLDDAQSLVVQSASALVGDQTTGSILYEKNADAIVPIASISKLMTAMVALDAKPSLQDVLTISDSDVDTLKGTRSRLRVGSQLSREDMLRLALMASENRAAAALSRYYPGGRTAFVAAMNGKAQALGMTDTHFDDPTGLTSANVSSARDLFKLVAAAHQYPLIRQYTTTTEYQVAIGGRIQAFHNTNSLVKSPSWEIGLSKTGYINEAGKCLVMQAWFNNKPVVIVLLDSWGKLTRIGDANRIKRWVESAALPAKAVAG